MSKTVQSRMLDTEIARYRAWLFDTQDETPLTEIVASLITAAEAVQGLVDEALELVEATIREYQPAKLTPASMDVAKMLDRAAVEGAVKRMKGK